MLQVYTRHSMKGENYRNFQVEISQSGKDPPPTLPVVEIEGNNPAGEMNFYFTKTPISSHTKSKVGMELLLLRFGNTK